MARNLVENCFPDTAGLLRRASPPVFDYLLPPSCTPLALGGVAYATLLPLCAFGLAASLHGYVVVKHSIYRRALLYYACMNVVAAMSHCQLYSNLALQATKHFWLAADVGFTSACSLCLCLAAVSRGQSRDRQQALQQLSDLVGPAALAVALLGNCTGRTIPFLNELLYVQPTLLAACLLFVQELLQPGLPAAQRHTINAAAVCFMVTPPLLLVNPLLCRYASSAGGCWWDATQSYFLGCNVAMMLLARYVRLQEADAAAVDARDIGKKSS